MTENKKKWDEYLEVFLKADEVENEKDPFVVIEVLEHKFDKEKKTKNLRLSLEKKGKKYLFDLNKTNMIFLMEEAKLEYPDDILGKILCFKKVLVNNPSTKKEVEALRIRKVFDSKANLNTE